MAQRGCGQRRDAPEGPPDEGVGEVVGQPEVRPGGVQGDGRGTGVLQPDDVIRHHHPGEIIRPSDQRPAEGPRRVQGGEGGQTGRPDGRQEDADRPGTRGLRLGAEPLRSPAGPPGQRHHHPRQQPPVVPGGEGAQGGEPQEQEGGGQAAGQGGEARHRHHEPQGDG